MQEVGRLGLPTLTIPIEIFFLSPCSQFVFWSLDSWRKMTAEIILLKSPVYFPSYFQQPEWAGLKVPKPGGWYDGIPRDNMPEQGHKWSMASSNASYVRPCRPFAWVQSTWYFSLGWLNTFSNYPKELWTLSWLNIRLELDLRWNLWKCSHVWKELQESSRAVTVVSDFLGRKSVMISLVKTTMGVLVECSVLFPRLEFGQDVGI